MRTTSSRLGGVTLAAALVLAVTFGPARAAEIPPATQAILKELKLDASILDGLDQELEVPAEWLEKAKAEGALDIIGSWDPPQFEKMSGPFRARFPDVKLSYVRGGRYDRGVKPLLALKQGRFIADIITSPGGDWVNFKDINALEDLRVLPNYKRLDDKVREDKGLWVGQKIAYRCMAYNTTKVKKEEMPKTWDDLANDPRWRGGKLGVPNRPNLWLSMLWLEKGPEWTKDFITKIFTKVKPQLRKEGANAMIGLTVAGEFDAAVAAAEYRVQQYQDRGAPVAFHCPEPVPMAISILMVLKDNPHKYSSLIFTNWFISKEGQVAQYAADGSIPVRSTLSGRKELMPYPEEVLGKPLAVRDEAALRDEYPKLVAYYDPLWKQSTGEELQTISVKLTGVEGGGRTIKFDLEGKPSKVTISARRTAVTLDGAKSDRSKLAPGMACKVTYTGPGASAAAVACTK